MLNYKIKLKRENIHTREMWLTYFRNSSVSLEKFLSTIPSAEAQIHNYRPKTICSKQDAADKYIQTEHRTKKVKHHIVKSHRAKGGKTAK